MLNMDITVTTADELPPNRRVRHPKYGRGTVTRRGELEDDNTVRVGIEFDTEGERWLYPHHAEMTLLPASDCAPVPVCWVHEPLPSDFEGDGVLPQHFPVKEFAKGIRNWREAVIQFEKRGIDESEFSYDIYPRDMLLEALCKHPAFRPHMLAGDLAEVDARYYAIEHRYPPGHASGTSAPPPEDIAAGRWWNDSPPLPRMRREGVDKDYDALKALAYELVNQFAPCGERIAKETIGESDVYADFILEVISPARCRHGNERDVAAGSDLLRERSQRMGLTLRSASIAIYNHPDHGTVFTVELDTNKFGPRIEAPLKKGTLQSYEWMWPCATSD